MSVETPKADPQLPVQDRILLVARQLFKTDGYNGTKTRTLAKAAGTSEAGLFRHFDNKYDILMAVYDDAWSRVNEWIDEALGVAGDFDDPCDELIEIITGLWRFYEVDPETSAFLIINTGNTDSLLVDHQDQATISDANIAYLQRIEQLCEAAVDAGLVGDLTSRALAEGLFGLSEGVMLGWYLFDKTEPGRMAEFSKISIDEALALLRRLLR